jgi:membrane protein DedA with SNARE-associated domain
MLDIGQAIYDIFSPLDAWGMLACIFIIFYIDAIIFPTLPELFAVIIFMVIPQAWFGLSILAVIAVAEVLGLSTLYLIVKKIHIPQVIEKAIQRYRDFLMVRDERMILLNRIAPIIPFIGAFVAICNWSFKRSIVYTLLGGIVKYGLIISMSGMFFAYFSSKTAQNVTLAMIIIVIGVSFAISIARRGRMRKKNENSAR